MEVALNLANSADPDHMQHYAAFHLGLHCLPKYSFRGFQYTQRYEEYWFINNTDHKSEYKIPTNKFRK